MSSQNNVNSGQKVELVRNLRFANCVSLLIAIIIGTGIFISPKDVIEETGSVGFALIIWVASGVVSVFGAFAYAELGCMIPKAGGEYEYIMAAFGNVPAFLFIWAFVVLIIPASFALAAITFANYALEPFFSGCGAPHAARIMIASAIILLVTFVNCYNLKLVQILSHFSNLGKCVGLLSIIGFGIYGLAQGNVQNLKDPFENTNDLMGGVNAFYAGLFTYAGWNYLSYVVEEIVNPNKTLPISIAVGLFIVTLIYLLANVSYFVLLSPKEMIASNAVAFSFVEKVAGKYSWTISIFVCLSCLGYINGGFLAASRTIFGAARKGHMPSFLALLNVKYLTPMTSIIFLSLLSLLCCFVEDSKILLKFTVLAEYIFITITVVGLLWLRRTKPQLLRPIKVNMFFPVAFLIICIFVILVTCIKKPGESFVCIAIILLGLPVYYIFIARKMSPSMSQKLDNFTIALQKLTLSVPDQSSN